MKEIIDRQTFVISVNFNTFNVDPGTLVETPSIAQLPMNLRFAADEMILKSICYSVPIAVPPVDEANVIQIWCNITNDGLIGCFPNAVSTFQTHDAHFSISNTFQTGNFILQFQGTDGSVNNVPDFGNASSYNPQRLISSYVPQTTFGTATITIEFIRHSK